MNNNFRWCHDVSPTDEQQQHFDKGKYFAFAQVLLLLPALELFSRFDVLALYLWNSNRAMAKDKMSTKGHFQSKVTKYGADTGRFETPS